MVQDRIRTVRKCLEEAQAKTGTDAVRSALVEWDSAAVVAGFCSNPPSFEVVVPYTPQAVRTAEDGTRYQHAACS